MPESRWSIRYESRSDGIPVRSRPSITSRLVQIANGLAQLIHPGSPFWTTEQGLQVDIDGWRVEYRVDLEQERITITAAQKLR
jgi:hypothetical protein